MRRFSQRNSLVTLSDINITPLLDLAFVLLIIFVITTPLLEQGLNLRLPAGDVADNKKIDPKDVRTVEISTQRQYMMGGKWMNLAELTRILQFEHSRNPRLLVYIRADKQCPYEYVTDLLNMLETSRIDQVSLRTTPRSR
jgi:biopolymer transport protein ExbD